MYLFIVTAGKTSERIEADNFAQAREYVEANFAPKGAEVEWTNDGNTTTAAIRKGRARPTVVSARRARQLPAKTNKNKSTRKRAA
jgi:hypothetical protein